LMIMCHSYFSLLSSFIYHNNSRMIHCMVEMGIINDHRNTNNVD